MPGDSSFIQASNHDAVERPSPNYNSLIIASGPKGDLNDSLETPTVINPYKRNKKKLVKTSILEKATIVAANNINA